jgi:hypothetical protein
VVSLAKRGLDPEVIDRATAELGAELEAAKRHRDQLVAWCEGGRAATERLERLRDMAAQAWERLVRADLAEQKAVLDLLDVRVRVVEPGGRATPGRLLWRAWSWRSSWERWEGAGRVSVRTHSCVRAC